MHEQDIHTLLGETAPPSGLTPNFADDLMVALEARTRERARVLYRQRMIGVWVTAICGLLALTCCAVLFPIVWFYVKMAVLPVALVLLVQYLDVRLIQAPLLKKQLDQV